MNWRIPETKLAAQVSATIKALLLIPLLVAWLPTEAAALNLSGCQISTSRKVDNGANTTRFDFFINCQESKSNANSFTVTFPACSGLPISNPDGGTLASDALSGNRVTWNAAIPAGSSASYSLTFAGILGKEYQEVEMQFDKPALVNLLVSGKALTPSCVKPKNCWVIDFSTLPTGARLSQQYAPMGVLFSGSSNGLTPSDGGSPLVVFDSTNPSGLDTDLGAPNELYPGLGGLPGPGQGQYPDAFSNVEIENQLVVVGANFTDLNSNGLVDVPAEQPLGGRITIDSEVPLMFGQVELLNVQSPSSVSSQDSVMRLLQSNGALDGSVKLPAKGSNSWQAINFSASDQSIGVNRLEIELKASGALSEIFACWLDSCPANDSKLQPGACGCGTPDTDSDGDGVADCIDSCPTDGAKTSGGTCGCGVPDSGPLGCLDCSGTPSGTKQLDSCGVCGGDGLSCVSCTITDQSAKLFALDGNSLQISKDIKAIAKIAKSCKPSSKKKNAQVSTIQKQAQVLHVVAWEATWLNPTTQQSCQGASVTAVCVTTSFAQPIAKYQSTLLELQSLADSASSFAKKSCKGSKPAATKINKLLKRAKKLTVESRSLSDTLQTETQSCN